MTTHRGAYLHALGVIAEAGLTPRSAYLWTLPMFHCNGWAYTWAVTATGASTSACRRSRPAPIWRALTSEGVTHLCAAPTVLTTICRRREAEPLESRSRCSSAARRPRPRCSSGRRAEPDVTHLYGLTETYGPIAVCAWNPDWDELPDDEQAALRARQGVGTIVSERMRVVDEEMRDVPPTARRWARSACAATT